MSPSWDGGWRSYVPVRERRRRAAKTVNKMKKHGRETSPVVIAGRKIARTFWGTAWCENLESYSDYSNRLPRGRTYVRNGSVIDLQIEAGLVRSLVSGSELYNVEVEIRPLAKQRWTGIKARCAGKIDSLVELLSGSISKGVMEIVTRKEDGLFPAPEEISVSCSCPDWAIMCKHVAATLYGVGARLDHEPGLLFSLRDVDPVALVEAAVDQPWMTGKAPKGRRLGDDDLSSVFGIDMALGAESTGDVSDPAGRRRAARKRTRTAKRSAAVRRPASKSAALAKKAVTKKATRKKATPKKATPKKATPKKATPKKATPKKATPKKKNAKKAPKKKNKRGRPATGG